MDNRIVINTGPLIAFGRMGCFDVIRKLPFVFLAPDKVRVEVIAGNRLGYSATFPEWIDIIPLNTLPSTLTLSNLDAGEAAVIEAALQNNISTVCIDELKGRRAALASGLSLVGSLGILGRAKELGLISMAAPLVRKAQASGIHYDQKLVDVFLEGLNEAF